jgi:excisionase family DNA binding protein
MQYSIKDAAQALGVSTNTVRRRLTSGLLTGQKVGNQWVINVPDDAEIPLKPALVRVREPLASDKEALAIDNELVKQLRADLANASDRITFLEGHISQLTNVLNPAKPRGWWRRMWRKE